MGGDKPVMSHRSNPTLILKNSESDVNEEVECGNPGDKTEAFQSTPKQTTLESLTLPGYDWSAPADFCPLRPAAPLRPACAANEIRAWRDSLGTWPKKQSWFICAPAADTT